MVETIKYEVIRKIDKVELRHYPRIIIAKVDNSVSDSFGLLFRFISGQNKQKEKVKMTSPVVSQDSSQEIKMTSPVFSEFSNIGYMAFVMPSEFTLETTPEPLDHRIKIEELSARALAVLRFSGSWSEDHFETKTRELLDELSKTGIKTRGTAFAMLYNPPFIPSFLRRNEVAVEIQENDQAFFNSNETKRGKEGGE
ncbi:MAG TPA: heme-binding protein [Candidatus Sulfotelmatobacter sp.]|nr:heme-binding protein [Candidatus Sulfotelmatobacter sp.]